MQFFDQVHQISTQIDQLAALPIAEATQQPLDQVRIILIFILQHPLGWFFHYCVRGTYIRHLFNIIIGFTIQLYIFKQAIFHVWVLTGVAYALMIVAPRQMQGKLVFLWVLAHLSYIHIIRMIADNKYECEISTFNLLQVCKLSALAFCYQDGDAKLAGKLTDRQERMKVVTLPNPIQIASYTLYMQNSALGVFFEYSDYMRFIERRDEYDPKNGGVPCPIFVGLFSLLKAFFFLGVFVVCSMHMPMEYMYTAEYGQHTIPFRYAYFMLSGYGLRFFYYGPFNFTTGAIQASGLGYNGKDEKTGKAKWDKIIGVYVWKLETSASCLEMLRYWNHQVHIWLKNYVNDRLSTPGQRAPAWVAYVTMMVSAFWHGFYPSYYICFFWASILSSLTKEIYRSRIVFAQYIPTAILQRVICNTCTFSAMNYVGVIFAAYKWPNIWQFGLNTHFFMIWFLPMAYMVMQGLGCVKKAKKMEEKLKAKSQ